MFFIGYDFPGKTPLGKPDSVKTTAADYNDVVSLMRHQMTLYKEKNQQQQSENARLNLSIHENKEKSQQQQDEITRLKQE